MQNPDPDLLADLMRERFPGWTDVRNERGRSRTARRREQEEQDREAAPAPPAPVDDDLVKRARRRVLEELPTGAYSYGRRKAGAA